MSSAPIQYQYITFTSSPIQSPERDIVLMLHRHKFVFTSTRGTQTEPETFYVNGKPARAVKPFRVVLKREVAQAVDVVPAQPPHLEMLEEENAAGWVPQEVQWYPEPNQPEVEAEEVVEQQDEMEQAEAQQLEMQQAEAQQLEMQQAEAQQLEMQQAEAQQLEMEQAEAQQLEMQQLERQLSELQEAEELEASELQDPELQEPQQQEAGQQQWPELQQLQSQETQTELQELHRQLLLLNEEEPAAAVATDEE